MYCWVGKGHNWPEGLAAAPPSQGGHRLLAVSDFYLNSHKLCQGFEPSQIYLCCLLHIIRITASYTNYGGFPGGSVVKNLPAVQEMWRHRFNPWVGKIPWRRKWQPAPVILPGETHGQRSLVHYSPRGRKE